MYVTLNISSNSVRLLSVRGRQVSKWGSVPLPPGLVRDGLILRPKVVGAVISALFKSTGVPKKQVIASLNGLSFINRILSLPQMESASQPEAIQRAARKEMPLPLEELYLCGQAISDRPDELDFFVLGVPRNLIDALVQTLAEAGIRPYLVDLNPLALARAAHQEEAIVVSLESGCFDIIVIVDGLPTIMHTITPRGEGATREDNIRRLVDELSKTVEFYNSNHPQNQLSPTTPLLLTGELAADTTTSELISAETEYSVKLLTPPLELPPDLPVALFATNIGLALKKLPVKSVTEGKTTLFRDINLNIISDKFESRAHWVKLPHVLLSLLVVTGLALLFPMDQLRSQTDAETARLQTELTGINQELDKVLLSVNEAEQIEDTIDTMLADAETIKQEHQYFLRGGGDFAYNLKLVTNVLPAEAYFTSVETDTDQITVVGEADSPFTVVDYVMALEALGKFSEVRIVWIDESQSTGDDTTGAEGVGVSFKVVISK
jgi:Tfp pilus assembly PilM family ATPase/Tfp pilus assembly protein PilN